MSDWSVTFVGGDPLEQRIGRLSLFLQDLRAFWPLVVPLVTSWWSRQFASEGGFAGRPWAPLNPDYAARKAQLGLRPEILQASGALLQAASNPTRSVTPRSLTLSIASDYLGYHQTGTDQMPARPLVFGDPLPLQAAQELEQAGAFYVRDLLSRF